MVAHEASLRPEWDEQSAGLSVRRNSELDFFRPAFRSWLAGYLELLQTSHRELESDHRLFWCRSCCVFDWIWLQGCWQAGWVLDCRDHLNLELCQRRSLGSLADRKSLSLVLQFEHRVTLRRFRTLIVWVIRCKTLLTNILLQRLRLWVVLRPDGLVLRSCRQTYYLGYHFHRNRPVLPRGLLR